MTGIKIRCYGEVQGVFFRKYTQEKAQELNLKGFVRNEPDGTVYIEAYGQEEDLKELESWCHSGSPEAEVSDVESESLPEDHGSEYSDFEVEH